MNCTVVEMKLHGCAKPGMTSAFTLIEMLVVIAVIAVLIALSMSGWSQAQSTMRRSQGISRLNQVSTAILAYASENNGRLPGPAPLGVYPIYNKRDAKTSYIIGSTIATYMGLPDPSSLDAGTVVQVPCLICPGLKARVPNPTLIPNFIQNGTLSAYPGGRPFGTQARGNTAETPPATLALLAGLPGGLSGIWAFTNADRELPDKNVMASGWSSLLPASPVYGNVRLRLYFDGHVAAVSKDEE